MSMYDYYSDQRDCPSCGNAETVEVEGTFADAYGTCANCGESLWVNRWEELDSEAAEAAGDARRDRDW